MSLTTTREFRWDDPLAPALNSVAGAFYSLVKACLAGTGTAYGTRQKAGWTVMWDDPVTYTIVLRNSQAAGGSGCYLRVQDNGPGAGGARMAKWDVYEDMIDINTGTGYAGGGWVCKSSSNGGPSAAWVLVADERTVYGSHYVNGTTQPIRNGNAAADHVVMYAGGDYAPTIAGDPGVFAAAGIDANPPARINCGLCMAPVSVAVGTGDAANASTNLTLARTAELVAAPTKAMIFVPQNGEGAVGGWRICVGSARRQFLPALLSDGVFIRGALRGLYVPVSPAEAWVVGEAVAAVNLAGIGDLVSMQGGTSATDGTGCGRLGVQRTGNWGE